MQTKTIRGFGPPLTPVSRLFVAVIAVLLVATACGGSDTASDLGDGTIGASSDADAPSLDDPELDEIIDDQLDEIDEQLDDEDEIDPRLIGLRLWRHDSVDEVLPGDFTDLAPDAPVFTLNGADRGTELGFVASYDAAWVVTDEGARVERLDHATSQVDVVVNAADLVEGGTIVDLVGDMDAIYAVVAVVDAVDVVELDPATGAERQRVTVPTPGAGVTDADSNSEWITLSYNATALPTPLISRASLTVEAEIDNIEGGGGFLTDTHLAFIEDSPTASGVDTLQLYALADQSPGERIELPGQGRNVAFGDTIMHSDADGVVHGITGDGPAIAAALAGLDTNFLEVRDLSIRDDLAVVHACCADFDGGFGQSLFAIDLTSGEIIFSLDASGTIVWPPAG